MHFLLRVAFSSSLILVSSICTSLSAQPRLIENVPSKFEIILNSKNIKEFHDFISKENLQEVEAKYESFISRFPNARWSINSIKKISNNEMIVRTKIQAEKLIENQKFSLEARQILKLSLNNEKMISTSIIHESSILKTFNTPLKVIVNSPKEVLTGSRYNIDIILDNPLGEDFLSGGIMLIKKGALFNKKNPYIDLSPLGAGGLFKSIQAPLNPGNQTIAALLVHSKGIISITETIKVVNNKKDLTI